MEEIRLTIDGREVTGQKGDTILKVCERNGIDVPTLCHATGLPDIGTCRLCIVEIEGTRGFNSSCTTPANDGMVVRTNTPALYELRKANVELLFAERNHICPFCEMSGDCELQELGYRFGVDSVRYKYTNPKIEVDSSSPNFVMDQNRCVLCRRCVRACAELAGVRSLGYKERGADTMVTHDLNVPVGESSCISCGSCAQVCPTGAIFDKKSAYKAKPSTSREVDSNCQQCAVGCQTTGVVVGRSVLRVLGDETGEPNKGRMCKFGRYESLNALGTRFTKPMVRKDGQLVEAEWSEALELVASKLAGANAAGAATVVATPRATNEALYMLDSVVRSGFGANVAVAGSEEAGVRAAAMRRVLGLGGETGGTSFSALHDADYVLMLDADPANTNPVIASIIRSLVANGKAKMGFVGSPDNTLAPFVDAVVTPERGTEGVLINAVMKVVAAEGSNPSVAAFKSVVDDALYRYTPDTVYAITGVPAGDFLAVARDLAAAKRPVIVYSGAFLANGDLAASVISLALLAGQREDGTVPAIGLAFGANSTAAARLTGLSGMEAAASADALLVLAGDDPQAGIFAGRLNGARFVAVQAAFPSELTERADVVLPARRWMERSGSSIAGDGTDRKFNSMVAAPEGVLDDVQLIAELGSRLGVKASTDESELASKVKAAFQAPAANLDRAVPVCVNYL